MREIVGTIIRLSPLIDVAANGVKGSLTLFLHICHNICQAKVDAGYHGSRNTCGPFGPFKGRFYFRHSADRLHNNIIVFRPVLLC